MRWTTIGRVMAALAVGGVLTAAVGRAQSEGQTEGGTPQGQSGKLAATVQYNGKGTVDKEHQIWIFVFDTPNITGESMPVATGSLAENGGTYKFVGLPKEVYIAVAFDEQGGYDMSGPPPPGTPVSIHGADASGTAATVATGGDDATVTVTFDDSIRMQ